MLSATTEGSSMPYEKKPAQAAARIRQNSSIRPRLALVLGSGFQGVLTWLQIEREIDFAKLPGFPIPTVQGHAGKVILGHFGQTPGPGCKRPRSFLRRSFDGGNHLPNPGAGRTGH